MYFTSFFGFWQEKAMYRDTRLPAPWAQRLAGRSLYI